MTDERIFSEEYEKGKEATQPSPTEEPALKLEDQIDQQVKQYGTGKPQRITIRAQIAND